MSRKFFRDLYTPVLARAGNWHARKVEQGLRDGPKAIPKLRARPPEQRREIASKAGKGRAAQLTTAERSRMAKWKPGRKIVPAEARRERASKAAAARWAKTTPEQRRVELKKIRRVRRGAPWPFPFMTRAQAGERGRQSQARARKLKKFLEQTRRVRR